MVNSPVSVKGQVGKMGQPKVDYDIDFIRLLVNVVGDVKVPQEKDNIGWVWKGGKLSKGPGEGSGRWA